MPNLRKRRERSFDRSGQPPTQQTRTASAVAVCSTEACRCPYLGCASLPKGARPLQQHLNTVHPLPGDELGTNQRLLTPSDLTHIAKSVIFLCCAAGGASRPLQPALEYQATHHADAPCAAYADDIVQQGKPEAVRRAFFALKERCAQVGLQVNDAKCHAYSRTHGAAQSIHAATGATHALRGLVIAGTPLGKDEFVRNNAAGKAEEAQCAVAL